MVCMFLLEKRKQIYFPLLSWMSYFLGRSSLCLSHRLFEAASTLFHNCPRSEPFGLRGGWCFSCESWADYDLA